MFREVPRGHAACPGGGEYINGSVPVRARSGRPTRKARENSPRCSNERPERLLSRLQSASRACVYSVAPVRDARDALS